MKIRINITLDKELHEQIIQILSIPPTKSFSAWINEKVAIYLKEQEKAKTQT